MTRQNEWEFQPRQHLFLHSDPFPSSLKKSFSTWAQAGTCTFPSGSTHVKVSNSGRLLWRDKHLQHGETELHMKNVYIDCLSHEFLKLWGTEGGSTPPPFLPILKNSLIHHTTFSSSNASLRNLIKTWFSPFELLHEQHIYNIIQN